MGNLIYPPYIHGWVLYTYIEDEVDALGIS
jgi:hypothetical protein